MGTSQRWKHLDRWVFHIFAALIGSSSQQSLAKSSRLTYSTPWVSARRTMRAWIRKNPELKAALTKAGYTDKAVILTPAQIQIHYDYLGEP